MPRSPVLPDDLYRLTLVGDAQIAPDGRRVAYAVKTIDEDKNDYVANIYLWEDGESRQYTAGDKDSAPRWSPDGRRLAFLSGRQERAQIHVMPADGGEPVRLTEQKLGAGAPVWSPDSAFIAFAGAVPIDGSDEDAEEDEDAPAKTRIIERAVYKADGQGFVDDRRTHIFTLEIATGDVRQITSGDCHDTAPAWSPDSRHIAFQANRDPEWDLESRADIWIVPREGGEPRRVTDGRGTWMTPVFSPDGSRIAMTGYARPAGSVPTYYEQLWTISRTGGDLTNLLSDTDLAVGSSLSSDWSIAGQEGPIWEEDGIYLLVSERGTCNVYRWQDGLHQVTQGCHHVMDLSVAGGTVAATVSDATHPAEVHLFAATARERESRQVITCHNAAILGQRTVVRPERVSFPGAEGVQIDGWVMKPAGWTEGQRYPVIVYIHGGPIFAYGETFFHEFQALAGAGFGLFYCNPHGGSSYGRQFQVSIMGDWGNLDYQDMMAGTDLVSSVSWVDSSRIGVAGGSYGGFMVNWLLGLTDRFAAAVTERSICNHLSQGGTSDWAATRGERLGGTPERDPELLWERSPLKYVANVKTPTLIIHSERDDRCPIEEGEQWFAALKRLRVPVRFIRFPEESHGLSRGGKPSRRLERLGYITEWFKRWL